MCDFFDFRLFVVFRFGFYASTVAALGRFQTFGRLFSPPVS
jgi:hypothetical protein